MSAEIVVPMPYPSPHANTNLIQPTRSAVPYPLQCVLLAFIYYALAVFGIESMKQSGHAAAIWWPNALLLSVLLRAPRKEIGGFLSAGCLANFAASFSMTYELQKNLIFGIGALLEVGISYWLIRGGRYRFDPCYNVIHFVAVLFIILCLGAVASASLSALKMSLDGAGYSQSWRIWWIAECIGMISLLPVGLSLSNATYRQLIIGSSRYEFAAFACGSLLSTWLSLRFLPYPFIVLAIPVLLASLRLNLLGTALIGLANVVLALTLVMAPELLLNKIDLKLARDQILIATALALIGPLLVAVLMNQRNRVLRYLQENERTLRDAMKYASIGMAIVDGQGRWIKVNPALCRMLGYSAEELQTLTFQDLTYTEDLAEDIHLKQQVIVGTITHYTLEKRYVRKNNDIFWANLSLSGVYDADNKFVNFVSQIQDIDDRKHAEIERIEFQRELEHRARHDALTGLINRQAFEQEARFLLEHNDSEKQHVACFLDLDRFKILNDSAGHAAGDLFLRDIAVQLAAKIRTNDTLARLGGDEFGLLLPECPLDVAYNIAETLIDTINTAHFTWNGRVFEIGASVGVVPFTAGSMTFAELLSRTDVACYTAKNEGRNRVVVYSGQDSDAARDHHQIQIAAGIREALQNEQFCLYAQPIVPLTPDKLTRACELLVRLRTDQNQLLSPGAFIPAAERYGLMPRIDRWVITKTLLDHGEAIAQIDALSLSINISGTSFNDAYFADFLRDTLRASAIPAKRICFELTETALINNIHGAAELIRMLQAEGCAIALDDFGSGLSSFNYLKNFIVQFVKIDGSFVRAMHESPIDRAIVESINQIAHRLGAETIAEHVETHAVATHLREIGIDFAQGYAFAKPQPIADFLEMAQKTAPETTEASL